MLWSISCLAQAISSSPASAAQVDAAAPPVRVAAVRVKTQAPPRPTEPGAPSVVEREASKTVNEALTPIRVFPMGGAKRGDGHAAFLADGVGITPYGFVKVTAIEDSSSPSGDDFPLPGFLAASGPDGSPEFHIKARSSRVGMNFEAYDSNQKWVIGLVALRSVQRGPGEDAGHQPLCGQSPGRHHGGGDAQLPAEQVGVVLL